MPFGDEYFAAHSRFYASTATTLQKEQNNALAEVKAAKDVYAVRRAVSNCTSATLKAIVEELWCANMKGK